ncbi:hypothetical protein PVAP13_6KG267906 [Panicum virgatum]|uniref:Uncharacterized protein n=1 Tax=Panicum virgatum TaxID=38727 RepID=A0A8T0RGX4_PANVG|nr:hypothetical protein PVAP13_6KG267906 [Panicum virgatum]
MICDGCHAPSDLRLIDIFAVRTLSKTHIWPGSAARAHHPPDCHLRRDAIPVFAGDVSPVTATPAMAGWAGLQLAGKCVVSLTKAWAQPLPVRGARGRGSQSRRGIFPTDHVLRACHPRQPILLMLGSHRLTGPACQPQLPLAAPCSRGVGVGPPDAGVAPRHWPADRSLAVASRYKDATPSELLPLPPPPPQQSGVPPDRSRGSRPPPAPRSKFFT